MGWLRLCLLATCAAAAIGCGKISFDVSQDIPATTIMGDPNSTVLAGMSDAPLTLDIEAQTQQRHTGPASSAHLKDLTFTITVPQNGTFYFAQGVSISLVPINPASRLPKVEIARLAPIPNETTIHITPVGGVDMLPYSNEGSNITATAIGRLPMEDTTYVGHVVVEVRI